MRRRTIRKQNIKKKMKKKKSKNEMNKHSKNEMKREKENKLSKIWIFEEKGFGREKGDKPLKWQGKWLFGAS